MDVLNHQAVLTPAEIRNLESCPLGASESSGYTQKMKKEWGWSCLVFMSLSEKWPLCLLTFYGLELGIPILHGRSVLITRETGKCGLVYAQEVEEMGLMKREPDLGKHFYLIALCM